MSRVVISGNWKMNKTLEEAKAFIEELKTSNISNTDKEVEIYVPFVYLLELNKMVQGTNIKIGAQNIHQEMSGAYTGEISPDMLKSIGIDRTLVGHSERRVLFNENDKIINKKVLVGLENGLNVTLCVGETLDEKNAQITNQILETQIKEGLEGVSAQSLKNVIIAYEPVWAIGTGVTATAEDANKSCKYIRELLSQIYGSDVSSNVVIQYGGSVKPDNIEEILSQSDINGALVGGASLESSSYLELVN